VNLTNLPVHDPMLVTVESQGNYKRRIFLKSIYQQSSIYLLDNESTANTVRFTLDDKTGQFPQDDSILFITRPVSDDQSTQYQIVASSQFGVEGFTEDLESGTRYRLLIEGPSGQQRVLGAFTPAADETVPLTIGRVDISGDVEGATAFGATTDDSSDQPFIRYRYRDAEVATDELRVAVYNTTGDSPKKIYDATSTDIAEMETGTIPVNTTNAEFEVVYNATRSGAPDQDGVVSVGSVPNIAQGFGLDPLVQTLLSFMLIIALMGLVILIDSVIASAVGVGAAGLLMLTGFVPIHPLQIAFAGAITILYAAGTSGR
jgi:hypothetical protein